MTRIHLRHPISRVYVNEILCNFPSSGIIFLKVSGFCLVKRWKDCHLCVGVAKKVEHSIMTGGIAGFRIFSIAV